MRAEITGALLTVSRGADDACLSVAWSHLHGSLLGAADATAMHAAPPQPAATALLDVSNLEVACLRGCVSDVVPEAAPFVPARTSRAALTQMTVTARLDAAAGALVSLSAEVANLSADTATGAEDCASPFASTPGAWDPPPSSPLRVIGIATGPHDPPADDCSLDGGRTVAEGGSSHLAVAVSAVPPPSARGSDTHAGSAYAVSLMIARSRVCALFLAEILAGLPADSGQAESGVGGASGSAAGQGADAEEPVALSLEICDSELFVALPARGDSEPCSRECGPQPRSFPPAPPLPGSHPAPLALPHQSCLDGSHATLTIGRALLLIHPELAAATSGLSSHAVASLNTVALQATRLQSCGGALLAADAWSAAGPWGSLPHMALAGEPPGSAAGMLSPTDSLLFSTASSHVLSSGRLTFPSTPTHSTSGYKEPTAPERFVICDISNLHIDVACPWSAAAAYAGGAADSAGAASVPGSAAVTCALLDTLTVALEPLHSSRLAPTPCSVDLQCPDGMHAALSLASADVLMDCMHALHATADAAASRPTTARPPRAAAAACMDAPAVMCNFDGAESDEGSACEGIAEHAQQSMEERWLQAARVFAGVSEVRSTSLSAMQHMHAVRERAMQHLCDVLPRMLSLGK